MDATRDEHHGDHGSTATAELMREVESLRAERDAVRAQAESRIAALSAELEKVSLDRDFARQELAKVRHQLAGFLRERYGRKAESVDLALFSHLLAEEARKSEAATAEEQEKLKSWFEGHNRTRRKRGARYENLPEKVRQVELPEAERKCSCCGEERVRIGEERHTRLEYKPAEAWRRRGSRSPAPIRRTYLRTVRGSSPSLRAMDFLGTPSSWRAETHRNDDIEITP